jgi:hypothetical protein
MHLPSMLPELICLMALGFSLPFLTTGVRASVLYWAVVDERGFCRVSMSIGRLHVWITRGVRRMEEAQRVDVRAKGERGRKRRREAMMRGGCGYAELRRLLGGVGCWWWAIAVLGKPGEAVLFWCSRSDE